MPMKQISQQKSNLAFAFQELLTATVRLRFNRQAAPKPAVFRAHMREAYRLSALEAESNGYQSEYIRIAGHAVIAFLDETVALSQNTAFSSGWSLPLTNELFPDASADTVYKSLENLLATRDSAEVGDTIEVLYLCLLLGYRGVLVEDGAQELSDFLDKISAKMLHIRGARESLVPDWGVPPEPIEPLPVDGARRLGIAAIGVSVALCVLTFVIGKLLLTSEAASFHSLAR